MRTPLGGAGARWPMDDSNAPFRSRLRISNLLRGLVALMAVMAIGAAFSAGQVALGIAGIVMLGLGIPAAYWASRTRRSLPRGPSTPKLP
jgi:hypothetical protein